MLLNVKNSFIHQSISIYNIHLCLIQNFPMSLSVVYKLHLEAKKSNNNDTLNLIALRRAHNVGKQSRNIKPITLNIKRTIASNSSEAV